MSAALTVRELADILDACPDPDAIVFVDGTPVLRVIIDRHLFTIPAESGYGRSALVLGSRVEDPADAEVA